MPENNVYVYFRTDESESVMVVINNSPESQTIDLQRFEEGIRDYTLGNDILSKKEINLKEKLMIEGKKSMVLELH